MDPGLHDQEVSRGETSKAMTSSSSVVVEGDEARMKGLEWATEFHGGGEMVVGGGDEPLTMRGFSSRWGAAKLSAFAGRGRGGRHISRHGMHYGAKWHPPTL